MITGDMFVLIVIVQCMSIQTYVHGLCTSQCECSSYRMVCKHGDIPTKIPHEIREIFIEQFNFTQYMKSQFENVTNVIKLDVQADQDQGDFVPSECFSQFTNLKYLGLHGKDIARVHPDAFLGLQKLLTLNLSTNPALPISEISPALNSTNVLPNLLSLSVAKVKTAIVQPTNLDYEFFQSVANGRKVKYLDISDLNIGMINYNYIRPVCNSLEFADVRKSVIGNGHLAVTAPVCKSLRTLDISGIIIPVLRAKFTFQTFRPFDNFCEFFKFYTYVENILANNVITEHNLEINNYSLDISLCQFYWKKISLAGNKFRWMNMSVKLHETTKKSITEINFSYNEMEYISPSVLLPSENIRILDLSNNKLYIMQEKYTTDFEKLFRAQTKLHYLNLSYNSLSHIPRETFLNNKMLKVIDISYNNIRSLDFSMSQLVSIEKVIASHNMIHTIDHHIRMELELVLRSTPNYGVDGNDSFHLYLEGNQFQCTCDETGMTFIEWLHSVEVIDENETLTCSLEKNILDVRGTGLTETKYFCRMEIIKKIAWISTPVVFTTVMLSIIFAVSIQRHRKRKLRIRTVINQIENGTFSLPHLVFLSHCSEDSDLVMNRIFPELCKHLSKMTRSNKPLVCLGDKHFRPGYPLRDEVMRCIEESSVFLAVISRNFCRRIWCNLEIGEAYDQKKPIIMLMVEHVEKELMDDFLQKLFNRYAHATWKPDDKGGHIEPEWKLFCKSIIQLAGKSTATAHPVDTPEEIIV